MKLKDLQNQLEQVELEHLILDQQLMAIGKKSIYALSLRVQMRQASKVASQLISKIERIS